MDSVVNWIKKLFFNAKKKKCKHYHHDLKLIGQVLTDLIKWLLNPKWMQIHTHHIYFLGENMIFVFFERLGHMQHAKRLFFLYFFKAMFGKKKLNFSWNKKYPKQA